MLLLSFYFTVQSSPKSKRFKLEALYSQKCLVIIKCVSIVESSWRDANRSFISPRPHRTTTRFYLIVCQDKCAGIGGPVTVTCLGRKLVFSSIILINPIINWKATFSNIGFKNWKPWLRITMMLNLSPVLFLGWFIAFYYTYLLCVPHSSNAFMHFQAKAKWPALINIAQFAFPLIKGWVM